MRIQLNLKPEQIKDFIKELNGIMDLVDCNEFTINTMDLVLKPLEKAREKLERKIPEPILNILMELYPNLSRLREGEFILETSSTSYLKFEMYNSNELCISKENDDMSFTIWNTVSVKEFNMQLSEDMDIEEDTKYLNEEGIFENIQINNLDGLKEYIEIIVEYAKDLEY